MLSSPPNTEQLRFSLDETRGISKLFNRSLLKNGVTREEFIRLAKKAHILHYSGHAGYDGLILESGEDSGGIEEYGLKDMFETLRICRRRIWLR